MHIRGLGHCQKTEELQKKNRGLLPTDFGVKKRSSYPKPAKISKKPVGTCLNLNYLFFLSGSHIV